MHNNTTTRDVSLPGRYLAFLKSDGEWPYFQTMEAGCVNRERLKGVRYSPPIKTYPTICPYPDQKDRL